MKYFEKNAFVGWGGQSLMIGTRPVSLNLGYNYLGGVVPFPSVGLRLGTKGSKKEKIPSVGAAFGPTGVGISVGTPKKIAPFLYSMKPVPRSIYKYIKDKTNK